MTDYTAGVCAGCGQPVSYNPDLAPTRTVEGAAWPVCAQCVEVINADAARAGLPPIVAPPGAYG